MRLILAIALLTSCRSDERGVALALKSWATLEGAPILARACGVDEGAVTGATAEMGALTNVLRAKLRTDGSFTARLRVLIRYSLAPNPRVASYDLEVHGRATRLAAPESSTPRPIPLPTFDGWLIEDVSADAATPTRDGLRSFFEDVFREA